MKPACCSKKNRGKIIFGPCLNQLRGITLPSRNLRGSENHVCIADKYICVVKF